MAANIETTRAQSFGLADVFFDPESVAKRLNTRAAWLWPFLFVATGSVLIGFGLLPVTLKVIERSFPPNFPPEQLPETLANIARYQRIGIFVGALIVPLKWLIVAGVVYLSAVLLDVNVKFKSLFALVAQCSLISLLQAVMTFLIITLRADNVRTVQDLSPGLGLDLLVRPASAALAALVGYFTVFNIWHIIILGLGLHFLSGCTKKRAFAATALVWVFPLVLTLGFSLLKK